MVQRCLLPKHFAYDCNNSGDVRKYNPMLKDKASLSAYISAQLEVLANVIVSSSLSVINSLKA